MNLASVLSSNYLIICKGNTYFQSLESINRLWRIVSKQLVFCEMLFFCTMKRKKMQIKLKSKVDILRIDRMLNLLNFYNLLVAEEMQTSHKFCGSQQQPRIIVVQSISILKSKLVCSKFCHKMYLVMVKLFKCTRPLTNYAKSCMAANMSRHNNLKRASKR